jgi:hypothetical protein
VCGNFNANRTIPIAASSSFIKAELASGLSDAIGFSLLRGYAGASASFTSCFPSFTGKQTQQRFRRVLQTVCDALLVDEVAVSLPATCAG